MTGWTWRVVYRWRLWRLRYRLWRLQHRVGRVARRFEHLYAGGEMLHADDRANVNEWGAVG